MISYRYAENIDVSDILLLDKGNFSNNFDEKFYLEYIENKKIIIAKKEEKIVGYILFNLILDEVEIYKIVVSEEFRNKHIASKIMEFFLMELKQKGIKKIFLEVRVSNFPAIKLYEKYGFVNTRKIVDYYGNPKEDGIMMVKEVL